MPLQHWSDRREEPLSFTDRLIQWFLIVVSIGGAIGQIFAIIMSLRGLFVLLCACAIGTFMCSASEPASQSCIVTAVSDGDTLTAMCGGSERKVRVSSVDAPESMQPYGPEAKNFTAGITLQQAVTLRIEDYDKYDRIVARVALADGRNLGRELARSSTSNRQADSRGIP